MVATLIICSVCLTGCSFEKTKEEKCESLSKEDLKALRKTLNTQEQISINKGRGTRRYTSEKTFYVKATDSCASAVKLTVKGEDDSWFIYDTKNGRTLYHCYDACRSSNEVIDKYLSEQ